MGGRTPSGSSGRGRGKGAAKGKVKGSGKGKSKGTRKFYEDDKFTKPGDIARLLTCLKQGAGPEDVKQALAASDPVSSKTWTAVIGVLGKQKRWDVALAALKLMRAEGDEINEYHCSAVIKACEVGGRWKEALEVLQDMRNGEGAEPNVFCYCAAIGACEKAGEWQKAVDLLRNMGVGPGKCGVEPNHFCYSAGIRACATAKQWQTAVALLEEMHELGVEPNLHTYTAAISACHRGGQWKRAMQLLEETREYGLEPDVVMYSATISACESARQWEQALALLKDMIKRGVTPTVVAFNATLRACEQGGRWEEALQLLDDMKQWDITPDIVAYSAAVGACEAANQKSKAASIVRRLGEALATVDSARQAFHGLVSFAKLDQQSEAANSASPSRADAAELPANVCQSRLVELVREYIPEMGARDLGLLLWALTRLQIGSPVELLADAADRLLALEADLSWQAVGLLDYGFRCGLVAEELQACDQSVRDRIAGARECLLRAGVAAVAAVSVKSRQVNREPADLLLSLDADQGPASSPKGPVLVVDDWQLAAGLKARGCEVRWWGRMSTGKHLGSQWSAEEPCSGAVVRLTGVQSNAGGASLRMAVAGAAARLRKGSPLWLCGLEAEGIAEAFMALQGLFKDLAELARSGDARVYRAIRCGVEAPEQESFSGVVPLRLGTAGAFQDVESWRVWPGLFAGGGLDIMTAFLLQRLQKLQIAPSTEVLDFCCGSGTIAKAVLQMQPEARVHAADADALAIEAALRNLPGGEEDGRSQGGVRSRCYLGDGWRPVPEAAAFDLVISNPPVHWRRQDDFKVVDALIAGAARRLRPQGRLWIVAQVNVPVGAMLEGHGFKAKADSDGRFVLWRARVPANHPDRLVEEIEPPPRKMAKKNTAG